MDIVIVGNPAFQERFKALLDDSDYHFDPVLTARTEADALRLLRGDRSAIAVLNADGGDINCLELLKKLHLRNVEQQVILSGGLPSGAFAISALNSGASYFLVEPVNRRNLNAALKKATRFVQRRGRQNENPPPQPTDTALSNMRQALEEIEAHLNEDYSLERAAGLANMSVSYFCAQIRREKGVSFKEYLVGRRIAAAKRLLRTSNHTVNKIAEMVGYENPNYFAKVFRAWEGLTPSEYRSRGDDPTPET